MPGERPAASSRPAGVTVRDRDLPRGVPLPGDRALARAGRRAGGVRPALRDDRSTAPCPPFWCDAANPYNEKALLCRALENSIYVAASNVAAPDEGSVTGVIAPDGTLVAHLDYGEVGVVAADIDLDVADALIARRWSPERNALI